jgi:hypothetical protein
LPKTAEVSHSECSKCHKGFEDAKIKIYDLPFPHRKHIARILNCDVCHASGEEHGKILKTRVECLRCHHQSASNCTKCHDIQVRFIQGEALGEKESLPDVMAEGVKCVECHATISQGHSPAEVKRTCEQCHEARYGGMPDGWQKEVSSQMRKLKLSLEALKDQRKLVSDPERRKVEALTKEVEESLRVIGEDKSQGAHNFVYTKRLMSEAEKKVLTAKTLISKVSE